MAEPTLQEVFGANATQDVNSITIDKSDLTALTASATNSAESLLTAINLKAFDYLNQTNFDNNLDQSILVELGLSSFLTRGPNNDNYRTDQMTVTLAKPDTNGTIDPDDY